VQGRTEEGEPIYGGGQGVVFLETAAARNKERQREQVLTVSVLRVNRAECVVKGWFLSFYSLWWPFVCVRFLFLHFVVVDQLPLKNKNYASLKNYYRVLNNCIGKFLLQLKICVE
jgi:hypothetical protein